MMMEYDDAYSVILDTTENFEQQTNPLPEGIQACTSLNENQTRSQEPAAWWSFAFYQRFFDVTTDEVLSRLSYSVKCLHSNDFLTLIQDKPDLYGPIWVCIMLSVETAIVSDTAYFLQLGTARYWRQTFKTSHQCFFLLFLYCWCLPTMIWIGQEWNPVAEVKFRLLDLWCLYGYAMTVFSPIIMLWALPANWTRWLTCTAACAISGISICRAMRRAFCKLNPSHYFSIQLLLFTVNALIGFSFILLFFPSKYNIMEPVELLKFDKDLVQSTILSQFYASSAPIDNTSQFANNVTLKT